MIDDWSPRAEQREVRGAPDGRSMSECVEVALRGQADLGEGPWWDAEVGELLWVDLLVGEIHRFNPSSGTDISFEVGQPVGTVARRRCGGLVCAVQDGVMFVDPNRAEAKVVAEIERALPHLRMNDGLCDPAGRLWVGTMAVNLSPFQGSLYRVEPDLQVTALRTGVSVSNGLDWSPDGRTFYFTDSAARCVDAYDFDVSTGDLRNGRPLIEMSDPVATPDGLAVDAEGNLWIAMWDGGCVRQYNAQGRLLRTIKLPVSRPTSVAFGGSRLDQLFITSARGGLSEASLKAEKHAGSIFVAEGLATGRLPYEFAG